MVDILEAFTERAEARAKLWASGDYADLSEAVDQLQHDAVRDGLVASIGQDAVQQIIADAFQPYGDICNPDDIKVLSRHGLSNPTHVRLLPALKFIDMASWDNEPLPQYEWAVPGLIPLNQTALFQGDGGVGKSTIGLQLTAAHVLGRAWLQFLPEPRPAMFVDAEDAAKVMQIRLWDVKQHYETTFGEMARGGLKLVSWTGEDAVLAAPGRSGKIEPTARYGQLLESMGDVKPIMTVIASTANVFAGNENDRSQVQQFIGLTTRLAMAANGSVLLINHPSLTGMSSDSGSSGSTQWHNSVRCRFYLKRITPEKGEQPDDDLRELAFKKVQYAKLPERMLLRRRDGLYLPMEGVSNIDRVARQATAKDVFLTVLARFARANRKVSDKPSISYAPALFAREDEVKTAGLDSRALETAMRELFKEDRIWNEPCGRPSRPTYHIAVRA